MKTRKILNGLIVMLFVAISSLSFVGCSSDDDGDGDGGKLETGWTESGNNLKYVQKYTLGTFSYTSETNLTFTNNLCTAANEVISFPSAQIAQSVYDAMGAESKSMVSLSGSKITVNLTSIYQGQNKDTIKSAIEAAGGWL